MITRVAYLTETYRSADACLQGIAAKLEIGWAIIDVSVEGKRNYTVYFRKDQPE